MKFSLRQQFLWMFLIIFGLGSGVGYRIFLWYNEDIVSLLGHRLVERNALYQKGQLLSVLSPEITLARKMASSPVLKAWVQQESDPGRRTRAMAELSDFRQFFRSQSYFFAIAESGHYYYGDTKSDSRSDQPRYQLEPTLLKDGWFYASLRNSSPLQLNVDTDRYLGITQIWINAVVRNRAGQGIAITGSGVDLSEVIAKVILSNSHESANMLIDRNGGIQAHRDLALIDYASVRKGETKEVRKTLLDRLANAHEVSAMTTAMQTLVDHQAEVRSLLLTIDGQSQLVGLAWIPEMRWFVISTSSPTIGMTGSRLPMGILILIAALASVLVVAAYVVERTVMRRLARLDKATRDLADGRYPLTLDDRSGDEIGRLTQAFSTMSARIASHTDELTRQVAERTQSLETLAHTDFLTGLLNRRGMLTRLTEERNRLSRQTQSGPLFAVLLIDLDHFKSVNDAHGHAAGDTVLAGVADVLRRTVRDYDACARWGGEEFLIGLFSIRSAAELNAVVNKLMRAIRTAEFIHEGTPLRLTWSVGAVLAHAGDDIDGLLLRADTACYEAKKQGRNCAIIDAEGHSLPH